MGVNVDIVDRDSLITNPSVFTGPSQAMNTLEKGEMQRQELLRPDELEDLRSQLLNEKDKFLISDKNFIDDQEKKKAISKSIKLPSRYVNVDKV